MATTTIRQHSGTEGPRHDPYGWNELVVTRGEKQATLRTGLASWVELITGENSYSVHECDVAGGIEELEAAFEAHIGFTLDEITRAYGMLLARREANDPYSDLHW